MTFDQTVCSCSSRSTGRISTNLYVKRKSDTNQLFTRHMHSYTSIFRWLVLSWMFKGSFGVVWCRFLHFWNLNVADTWFSWSCRWASCIMTPSYVIFILSHFIPQVDYTHFTAIISYKTLNYGRLGWSGILFIPLSHRSPSRQRGKTYPRVFLIPILSREDTVPLFSCLLPQVGKLDRQAKPRWGNLPINLACSKTPQL